jgi:hypothetical protein
MYKRQQQQQQYMRWIALQNRSKVFAAPCTVGLCCSGTFVSTTCNVQAAASAAAAALQSRPRDVCSALSCGAVQNLQH